MVPRPTFPRTFGSFNSSSPARKTALTILSKGVPLARGVCVSEMPTRVLRSESALPSRKTRASDSGRSGSQHRQIDVRTRSGMAGSDRCNRLWMDRDIELARKLKKSDAASFILHFSTAFSLPSETFTYDVIQGLEDLPEFDNHVVHFRRELVRERPFDKTIQLYGYELKDLEAGNAGLDQALRRVLDGLEPHIVHCHFGWIGIPFVAALKRMSRQLPVVITMHGTDVNTWPAWFPWYREALKGVGSDRWVSFTTHTQTYKSKLLELGVPEQQVTIISNSFNPKFTGGRSVCRSTERSSPTLPSESSRLAVWTTGRGMSIS